MEFKFGIGQWVFAPGDMIGLVEKRESIDGVRKYLLKMSRGKRRWVHERKLITGTEWVKHFLAEE